MSTPLSGRQPDPQERTTGVDPQVTSATRARLDKLRNRPQSQGTRDILIGRTELETVRRQVEAANQARAKRGQTPFTVAIHPQHAADALDPIRVWERLVVRLTGDQGDLEDLTLTGLPPGAEYGNQRIDTMAVLTAAATAVRLNNYVYVPDGSGPDSTPAQVNRFVEDQHCGQVRMAMTPTTRDRDLAEQTRLYWARVNPTNRYQESVSRLIGQDTIEARQVTLLASAIAGYLRELNATAPSSQRSRWLNKVGEKIQVEGVVYRVQPVNAKGRLEPHYLTLMRTAEGDVVKCITWADHGLRENDAITLFGVVKEQTTFNGEKQTELRGDAIVKIRGRV